MEFVVKLIKHPFCLVGCTRTVRGQSKTDAVRKSN